VSVRLDGPGANWRVDGAVTVIDGAYLRNFELTDRIQAIGVNIAPSRPFWEASPALANAYFALTGQRIRTLPFFPNATMGD